MKNKTNITNVRINVVGIELYHTDSSRDPVVLLSKESKERELVRMFFFVVLSFIVCKVAVDCFSSMHSAVDSVKTKKPPHISK